MEPQPLRTTGDRVLIHVPERSESTISVAGKTLYFDSSWQVQQNKVLRGIVVACPEVLGDSYLLSRKGFTPGRVPVSAIQDVLKVGEEVYFDHTVTEEAGRVKQAPYEVEGVGGVYRANVNQLVARVREGVGGQRVLEPYGSYVLLRECWPGDVQEMQVPGLGHKLHLRVSASGLALGSEDIPPLPYQGIVAHVGLPLRGQPCRVQVGDQVVVDQAMCGAERRPLKMKIEGEEYLCIRHDYIHAVLREAAKPLVFAMPSLKEREPLPDIPWAGEERPITGLGLAAQAIACENRPVFDTSGAWMADYASQEQVAREVPQGYNYDPEIIAQACRECGVEPDIARVVRQHQLGLVRSDVVARALALGGITKNGEVGPRLPEGEGLAFELNGEQRWVSKEDIQKGWAFRQQQMGRLPGFGGPLVTTCCGADFYTHHPLGLGEGGQVDMCRACIQVAHLVPAAEFSNNKPAA